MSYRVRNNTSQLIEIHWGGGTAMLLPHADLDVSNDLLETGQIRFLTRTGRVSLELLAEGDAPNPAAAVAEPARRKAPAKKPRKT